MRLFLAALAAYLTLASATPVRWFADDTADDMTPIIAGSASCAAVGVLFARGTFDNGNIGVWVGPDFHDGLKSSLPSVAVQGVDPNAYPATFEGYFAEYGSNAGAKSMAQTAEAYAKKCPDAAIVIAGWSQGALVAHKALDQLDGPTLGQVAGLVTFGDPWPLFFNTTPPIPAQDVKGYCVTALDNLDPLCADLPADFMIPTTIAGITGPIKDLPNVAKGVEEAQAAASIVERLPVQVADALVPIVMTSLADIQRALVFPAHFVYGNNGMAAEAAKFIAGLDKVKAAKA